MTSDFTPESSAAEPATLGLASRRELQPGSSYRWKTWGSVLLIAIGILLLTYGEEVRFAEVFRALKRFSWATVCISLTLAIVQCGAQGLRLWALLPKASDVGSLNLLRIFSLGQLANTFLPGRAGDMYKVASLSRSMFPEANRQFEGGATGRAERIAQAAGSVLVADKLVDLGALLFLISIVTPSWLAEISIPSLTGSSIKVGLSIGVVSLLLTGLYFIRSRRFVSRLRSLFSQVLQGSSGLLNWPTLLMALFFGIAAWALEASVLVSLSSSWDWRLSFSQAIWVLVVLNLGIALPISFANLGTFEAAVAFGLSRFQVPLPEALALAGIHHLLQVGGVVGLALISGCRFFKRGEKRDQEFRVGPIDKKRAIDYYESLSKNYNISVAKGPLGVLRDRERGAILELAALQDSANQSLIDVGCGGGFYALAGKRLGLKVTAVDLASGMIERLHGHVDETYVSDLDSLEIGAEFDVVICSGVLDFVLSPERSFQNLCKLVAPGGRLIIQAPRSGLFGWIYRLEKRLLGIQVNLYSAHWFKEEGRARGLKLMECRYPLPTNQVVLLVREPR